LCNHTLLHWRFSTSHSCILLPVSSAGSRWRIPCRRSRNSVKTSIGKAISYSYPSLGILLLYHWYVRFSICLLRWNCTIWTLFLSKIIMFLTRPSPSPSLVGSPQLSSISVHCSLNCISPRCTIGLCLVTHSIWQIVNNIASNHHSAFPSVSKHSWNNSSNIDVVPSATIAPMHCPASKWLQP